MHLLESLPGRSEYFALFATTGWNEEYRLTEDELFASLRGSWHAVSAYEGDTLIGFGRTISDGVLHALIVDMIIDPRHQRKGVGSAILERLVERCRERMIRDVQLFCAKGKSGFYEKHRFARRDADAPGMELRTGSRPVRLANVM